ncbi:MAG: hypothetical protein R3B93_20515 [Bacteroidia bacterium]
MKKRVIITVKISFSFPQKGGKWGIKDEKTGSIISQPTWDRIDIWELEGQAWKPMASVGDAPVNYPTYDLICQLNKRPLSGEAKMALPVWVRIAGWKALKPIYESCSPFVHGLARST